MPSTLSKLQDVCRDVASTLLGLSESQECGEVAGRLEELSGQLSKAAGKPGRVVGCDISNPVSARTLYEYDEEVGEHIATELAN